MPQGEKTLALTERFHKRFIELAHGLCFDKQHPQQVHVVALYGSMLELSSGMLLIAKSDVKSSVPILLRSLLEAFVDLHNLRQNAAYGYTLQADYVKDSLKFLKEAERGTNQYLATVSAAPDLQENIAKHEQQLQAMKDKGAEELKIRDRFERAGLLEDYATIYRELCTHSHNTLRALRGRHVEKHGGDYNVVFFRTQTLDDIEHYLGIACMALMRASHEVHEFLNRPSPNDLADLQRELDTFVANHEAA